MSAVGTDASFMLEKALEEMDDIFKDAERRSAYSTSPLSKHSSPSGNTNRFVDKLTMSLRGMEEFLEGHHYRYSSYRHEEAALFDYMNSLPCMQLFCQRFVDTMHDVPMSEVSERLRVLRKEKDVCMSKVLQLTEQLKAADRNLITVKEVLAEERMHNTHLPRVDARHNTLHDDDAGGKDAELQRLRRHIEILRDGQEQKPAGYEDATLMSLKTRLREKASDVNRLKLMVDDLKASHEAKDTALEQILREITLLRDQNQELQRARSEQTTLSHNGHSNGSLAMTSSSSTQESEEKMSKRSSFGKGLFKRKNFRSTSEPNLASNDVRLVIQPISVPMNQSLNGNGSAKSEKRSLDEQHFANWSVERVQYWFEEEGLGMYASQCVKVITKGEDLLRFSHMEMERLLGMSNPIHQKKLILALQAVQSSGPDYVGRLDHNWMLRWLDDLGLPQYKDAFYENRIDGRVLHYLTVDDLFCMKVYNQLHHVSLRRAIQFLRHQRFHPQYLRESANMGDDRSDHVMLWTNMRVMQWLRVVDLAEYAPNLRGSGVHGALMVLEPRFNAETLANLLSIPMNKSLLRRHLHAQFATLLNETAMQQKDMMERTPNFIPLNSSDKHKAKKKVMSFGSLRRRKSENELDRYLSPMDNDVSPNLCPPVPLNPDDLFEPSEDSFSPSLSIHGSESEGGYPVDGATVKTLGQFSQELTHLTTMLNNKP